MKSRQFVFRKTATMPGTETRAESVDRGHRDDMVISNFDSRTKGKRTLPEERFQFLRELEEQVRRERLARKQARLARPAPAA
jgi:hypothetical protein